MNARFKKILPHIIAVLIFLVIAVIYCRPTLEGKALNQHDVQGWKGMAQQSFEYKEKFGNFPLWTNSMFSGMPAYQIAMDPHSNVGKGMEYISKVFSLGLPIPISFFFLACLGFYILCIVSGANPWVSMLGAIAYAYSTYNPIIVSVGHNTKMMSLAYAPLVIAGMFLLYQRKYLLGFSITAFFSATLIGQNHLQIVYYTLLIAGIIAVCHFIKSIKEKEFLHSLKASALGLIAGIAGLATTAVTMLPTYEYAKESMRGGVSQLTLDKNNSTNKTKGGLDKDYALRWSVGKMETFTFMVPGLYGGSNGGNEHTASAEMVKKLGELGVPEENGLAMTNGYSYWGSMSALNETTSGPVYLGAIICFLFIFGFVYINSWHKWWILGASAVGILLAWGSNFKEFNYFMLDYLPYFSKFRAPSMALVIPQFCIPFLGVLAIQKLISEKNDWPFAWKKLRLSAIITGSIILVITAFYLMADYTGKGDAQIRDNFKQQLMQAPPGQQASPQMEQQAEVTAFGLMNALKEDRKALAGRDLFRSVIFISLALIMTGLFIKRKINAVALSIGLGLLTCIDLFGIDKRYLSYDDFREKEEMENLFTPSQADMQIKTDPDHANFRVFNQSSDFTNESVTSYHHNSIGGYHPAKLGLYQDIIEHQIGKGNMQVFNMLNTKYFISRDRTGNPIAQLNPGAFGNCWLVKGIKFVNNANEEMLALDSTNLRDSAVVDIKFKPAIKQLPVADSSAMIKIKDRNNDHILYDFSAASPQFAVLSEVYYSGGWNAYIDGKKADYVKADYVLRGIQVPAGRHTVEFKFEPASFSTGRKITMWSTILIYLSLIATLIYYLKNKK